MMFGWFSKQSKIERITVKLAGAKAAYDEELRMARASNEMYPIVMSKLRREIAEYEATLNLLKGNHEHSNS